MADDFNSQNEVIVGNRRLRKIKRPKQHTTPLTEQNMADAFNMGSANQVVPAYDESQNNQMPYQQDQAYIEDASYAYDNMPQESEHSYNQVSLDKKKIIGIAVACLCVGLLFGRIFFSGSNVVQNGLQGVVVNPEVPKGRSRCGVAEKTQGCVLYVMNPQRQELNGRDFYDLASQLTGRQRFVIETGNMRYSSYKIKPGAIAQLNIPPLQ